MLGFGYADFQFSPETLSDYNFKKKDDAFLDTLFGIEIHTLIINQIKSV